MAGVLYSCQRLLIELYKMEDLTKYFLLLQKYMLNSSFIRLLSIKLKAIFTSEKGVVSQAISQFITDIR